MPIYLTRSTVTIQIYIRGGITAAKGLTDIYMVHSVTAVSLTKKVSEDSRRTPDSYSSKKQTPHTFSSFLEEEIQELKAAPNNCHTVTYGTDRKLHTFLYQPRDYQLMR